jgi:hypothetical protein
MIQILENRIITYELRIASEPIIETKLELMSKLFELRDIYYLFLKEEIWKDQKSTS